MFVVALFSLIIVGIASAYYEIWLIFGLVFGALFSYLFTTEYMFKRSMGRNPTDDEEKEMFDHLFKR